MQKALGISQHLTPQPSGRLWEIAENLHRAELTALERAEHIAEWVRLTEQKLAQVAPVSERGRVEGRGNKGGINAATRELGIDRSEAQRAVMVLLGDAEWKAWSNYEIARRSGVAESFVRKVKSEGQPDTTHNAQYEPTATTTFIHPKTGQPTEMRTGNIGHSRPPAPPPYTPPAPPASTTVYGEAGAPKSTTILDAAGKPLAVAWPPAAAPRVPAWTPPTRACGRSPRTCTGRSLRRWNGPSISRSGCG